MLRVEDLYYGRRQPFEEKQHVTCGLLRCFYQQFGLLFWRHPFTAEDPLVSKWCHAKFLQVLINKNYIF